MPRMNRGVIKILFIIIVAILILSYFRINLRELFSSSNFLTNLTAVWQFLKMAWRDFMISPLVFILEKLLEILHRVRS